MVVDANEAENSLSAKWNWWTTTGKLVRVTKGKRLIISGGAVIEADLRPPKDVANQYASNFLYFYLNPSITIQFASIAITSTPLHCHLHVIYPAVYHRDTQTISCGSFRTKTRGFSW